MYGYLCVVFLVCSHFVVWMRCLLILGTGGTRAQYQPLFNHRVTETKMLFNLHATFCNMYRLIFVLGVCCCVLFPNIVVAIVLVHSWHIKFNISEIVKFKLSDIVDFNMSHIIVFTQSRHIELNNS